ncbi:hypothetical protein HYH03_004834 [Edaphochlamys debaryana]|uniref:Uncharacterized protein n=1 Tax=Edaphochlamys debaryana TaxID=47281 RepID=A0A835Y6Q8_9CHLO|nr:hypothetical protein HYH03_004834 [Edaphochlamys debaryana]|eukprot:KAG2497250.1 hypothetical protein HYH03_004834 [Edaphochlamys debaryana]
MAEQRVALVRAALQNLYCQDGPTRKAADNWLQTFRNSAGAWQLCAAMLSMQGLAEYEHHFAAHTLRLACWKVPEVLEPLVLQGLTVQLAALLLTFVGTGAWAVSGQLASALAGLAVRAVRWDGEALVAQLLSLLAPRVAGAMLADLTLGPAGPAGGPTAASSAAVMAAVVSAEKSGVYALLQVVAHLPEAISSRVLVAPPQRRAVLASALAADATVVALLRIALIQAGGLDGPGGGGADLGAGGSRSGVLVALQLQQGAAGAGEGGRLLGARTLHRAGLALLQAWAEQLRTAPRGMELEAEILNSLFESLVTPDVASMASECICALLTCCGPDPQRGGADNETDDAMSDVASIISGYSGTAIGEPYGPYGSYGGPSHHELMAAAGRGSGPLLLGGRASGSGGWSDGSGRRGGRVAGGGGSGGSGGSSGRGRGGRSAAAAAAAGGGSSGSGLSPPPMTPDRQLANSLLMQRIFDGLQALLQGAAAVFQQQQEQGQQPGIGGVGSSSAAASAGAPAEAAFWLEGGSDPAVLQAVCSVLCAAAAAVLPGALAGDAAMQARFNLLYPQLLALLLHNNSEVALSCVSFWQDTYLAHLLSSCAPPPSASATPPAPAAAAAASGGPPPGPSAQQQPASPRHQPGPQQAQQQQQRPVRLEAHLPLLGQLLAGLVARAALGPQAAATSTADARDLPEEVRMVRRELGATMRDLVELVGPGHVAQFLDRLVSEHASQLLLGNTGDGAAGGAASGASGANSSAGGTGAGAGAHGSGGAGAGGAGGGRGVAWTRLESSLYAANVALCSGGSGGGSGFKQLATAGSGGAGSTGMGSGSGSIPQQGGGGSGVFGRASSSSASDSSQPAAPAASASSSQPASAPAGFILLPPVDDAHVASIARTAAAAVAHPAGSLKLAGTALTLVGGLASWYAAHPGELSRPLDAVRAALSSADEKLARNAATALNRLCMHPGCAALLLGPYVGWVAGLGPLLPGPDVPLRNKPEPGVDMSSRELLVASLVRLACTSAAAPQQAEGSAGGGGGGGGEAGGGEAAAQGLTPPQQLLQQLLAPRVLAAAAELERLAAATAAVSASGGLQGHLQLWRSGLAPRAGGAGGWGGFPGSSASGPGGGGGGGGDDGQLPRAPLCLQGVSGELQQLGALATLAAQRLNGLASMLLFAPVAGSPPEGTSGGGGGGGIGGGGGRGAGRPDPASAAASSAAAASVLPLLGWVVQSVWPHLMGCLQPQQSSAHASGAAPASSAAALQPSLLLATVEGSQLLPAACSLLQASLRVVLTAGCQAHIGAATTLLSNVGSLLASAQGGGPIPPTEQQLSAQHWPLNLDWPDAVTSGPPPPNVSARVLLAQQQQQSLRLVKSQHGPPVCVLQLVLTCLPACSELHTPAAHTAQHQQQASHAQHAQHAQQPGAVADQVVRACSVVVRHACEGLATPPGPPPGAAGAPPSQPSARLLAALPGSVRFDSDRMLAVLPVLHALLLHAPQALAGSRELLDLVAGATIGCMPCSVPDACRAALEWTQLLLSCSAFAPQPSGAPPVAAQSLAGGRSTAGARPGGGGGGGGGNGGLALLLARCSQAPWLEAAFAEVGAQLDAPCLCSAPDDRGLVLPLAGAGGAAEGATAVAAAVAQAQAQAQAQALAQAQAQAVAQAQAQALALGLNQLYAGGMGGLNPGHTTVGPHTTSRGLSFMGAGMQPAPQFYSQPGRLLSAMPLPNSGGFAGAGAAGFAAQPSQPLVANLGAAIFLSLMVAASGCMPPDLMLPIASCMHGAWAAMGAQRFRAWLRVAAVDLSTLAVAPPPPTVPTLGLSWMGGAGMAYGNAGWGLGGGFGGMGLAPSSAPGGLPWVRLKPEILTASLAELWGEDCERDLMRFKRALKGFCGGKKKGAG